MSDLISRLAARATGASAPARPHVRSAFEPASVHGAGPTADLHPGRPVPLDQVAPGDPLDPLDHLDHLDQVDPLDPLDGSPSAAAPHGPHRARAAPEPAVAEPGPVRRSPPSGGADPADGGGEPVGAPVEARPVPPRRAAGRHEPVAASVVVAHLQGAPTDRVPGGHVPAPAPDDAAPSVQIHIGRLDVRANLVAAPTPRPPSAPSTRDEGLSLQEYLDGKRSGR